MRLGGGRILQRVEEAERSLQAGSPEAAFLLAWSACEATIRELLSAQGVSKASITSPRFVLDQAVFHGVISRDEHDKLSHMLKYRNVLVHGFDADDFSGALVRDLISAMRRITSSATPDDGSGGAPLTESELVEGAQA